MAKTKTEAKKVTALVRAMEECLEAVDYVGLANYSERIVEARAKVRRAFAALSPETSNG